MSGEEQGFKGYAPSSSELFESFGELVVESPLFGGELAGLVGGRQLGILRKLCGLE